MRPYVTTARHPAGAGCSGRGGDHRARSARPRPSSTSRISSQARARWWPVPPRSTTGRAWRGPSTSTWLRAPTSSWPRWAPTAKVRSPTSAGGALLTIAVITAIGPVHLERFKTEDAIVVAKAEITETAQTVVLNVDDPRLAAFADQLAAAGGKSVVRCSAVDTTADVRVRIGRRWPLRHLGVRGRGCHRDRYRPARVGATDQPRLRVGRGVRARRTARGGARAYRWTPSRCQPARVGAGALGGVGDRRHVQLQPQRGPGRPGRTGPARDRGPPCGRHPGDGRARPPSVRGESRVRPRLRPPLPPIW